MMPRWKLFEHTFVSSKQNGSFDFNQLFPLSVCNWFLFLEIVWYMNILKYVWRTTGTIQYKRIVQKVRKFTIEDILLFLLLVVIKRMEFHGNVTFDKI